MWVTLKTIADAIGTSRTTVSRALRNDPKISERMRAMVKAKAKELGYSKDPRFSELTRYIVQRRHGKPQIQEEIAYVDTRAPSEPGKARNPVLFSGIEGAARNEGYRLEHYYLGEGGLGVKRFEEILQARGVRGIVVAPAVDSRYLAKLSWDRYVSVFMGQALPDLQFHRVNWDIIDNVRRCFEGLRGMGYTRIGVIAPKASDAHLGYFVHAAKAIEDFRQPESRAIPMLDDDRMFDRKSGSAMVENWLKKHRIEAVTAHYWVYHYLKQIGYQMPGDFGYADWFMSPYSDSERKVVTGVHPSPESLGEVTMSLLQGKLAQNRFGLPRHATFTMVQGDWRVGETTAVQEGSQSR